jgi:transcription elongation factor Elf1
MEPRKLTKEDIDKVRDIEGFPIAKDEDIIALSNAPFYTACPNPFIDEFIRENGTPYDEATDDYHCEPFAADVSEGKYNPVYRMHPYHTKVPHAAIVKYLEHYTKPGDLVFDGFCGTGMTGVAAQLCGEGSLFHPTEPRKAIICDISPEATFISNAYNQSYSFDKVFKEAQRLADECEKKYGWMYKTKVDGTVLANVDSCVWSDVFICPHCGHEFVFWDEAVDVENGKIPTQFSCQSCGAKLKKNDCQHAIEISYDKIIGETIKTYKQIPVFIGYSGAARGTKKTDEYDLDIIKKIEDTPVEGFIPIAIIPNGEKTQEAITRGITRSYQFYYKRSLLALSYLWTNGSLRIKSIVSKLLFRMTKRYALTYQSGTWGAGGGPTPGTLYIPSLVKELNIINQFRDAVRDYSKAYSNYSEGNVLITTQSSTAVPQIPDNTIDYIFTDPPFGSNIMYSELNFIWESWLNVFTNEKREAIVSQLHGKNYSVHDMFTTTDTDIERQFQVADVKLGREGIGIAYGNKYMDMSDLSAFKVDVILFVADQDCMNRLYSYAENRFHSLNDDYRRYIATIDSEKIRREYDNIVSDGDVISKHNFRLPETIQVPHEAGGTEYKDHLFVNDNTGTATMKLNSWEAGVIEEEEKRPDFVCWIRNPSRASWALCIPYEIDGEIKPTFPDFIIVRKDPVSEYVIDILEPHNPDFKDNLGKAKGFAEYARQNPGVGSIQLIRMSKDAAGKDRFRRLNMYRSAIRDKVSHAVNTDELDHIFNTDGDFM